MHILKSRETNGLRTRGAMVGLLAGCMLISTGSTMASAAETSGDDLPNTKNEVLVHEIKAGCTENPESIVCKTDEKYWANVDSRAKSVIAKLEADKDFMASVMPSKPGIPPTKPIDPKLTAGLVVDKALAHPEFKKYASRLKPSASSIAAWAASVATTGTVAVLTGQASGQDVAETAVSGVPVVGQLYGFSQAASKDDAEGMITNSIALAGIAAAVAGNPVTGSAASVGLAAYELGKLFKEKLIDQQSGRDWTSNPPEDIDELYEAGAHISWTEHDNATVDLGSGQDSQTIIFDSRRPETLVTDQPRVSYTLNGSENPGITGGPIVISGKMGGSFDVKDISFSQAGRTVPGNCEDNIITTMGTVTMDEDGGFYRTLFCAPKEDVTVTQDNPVSVKITYEKYGETTAAPADMSMSFEVTPENGGPVTAGVPNFSVQL
ncbi:MULTISPECIES: hypothetical protein [Amycolatopsis]|uniref:hypothetical protein n=1 Tax=Amycolatopsis TaxID=1813 RepID=UPI00117877DB|nr:MULTISPECIES: hypothetical protein [Amycolatopsis]